MGSPERWPAGVTVSSRDSWSGCGSPPLRTWQCWCCHWFGFQPGDPDIATLVKQRCRKDWCQFYQEVVLPAGGGAQLGTQTVGA